MTNREVIDKMSNGQLAAFLDHVDCINCAYYAPDGDNTCSEHEELAREMNGFDSEKDICKEGIAKWLSQEADFRMTDYVKEDKE